MGFANRTSMLTALLFGMASAFGRSAVPHAHAALPSPQGPDFGHEPSGWPRPRIPKQMRPKARKPKVTARRHAARKAKMRRRRARA